MLISFVRAKELGMQCSYELPIAHWATAELLAEEAEYPIEPTLESTREPEEKLFKRRKLRLAVESPASQFVLDSIPLEAKKQHPNLPFR